MRIFFRELFGHVEPASVHDANCTWMHLDIQATPGYAKIIPSRFLCLPFFVPAFIFGNIWRHKHTQFCSLFTHPPPQMLCLCLSSFSTLSIFSIIFHWRSMCSGHPKIAHKFVRVLSSLFINNFSEAFPVDAISYWLLCFGIENWVGVGTLPD